MADHFDDHGRESDVPKLTALFRAVLVGSKWEIEAQTKSWHSAQEENVTRAPGPRGNDDVSPEAILQFHNLVGGTSRAVAGLLGRG